MVAIPCPYRCTVDTDKFSTLFFAVGKIDDEGMWKTSPDELGRKGL